MKSSPKLVRNAMSRWTKLCEKKDLKGSPEKQMEAEEDLLDYLRKWNPLGENELVERILAHPVEEVCFDLYDMMLFYLVTSRKRRFRKFGGQYDVCLEQGERTRKELLLSL